MAHHQVCVKAQRGIDNQFFLEIKEHLSDKHKTREKGKYVN